MTDPLFDLAGRVGIVTGSSGQLGRALCGALADRGMTAVGLDLLGPRGDDVVATLACDVVDRASVETALARVEAEHGVPHLLVNAAGIDAPPDAPAVEVGPFEDVPV